AGCGRGPHAGVCPGPGGAGRRASRPPRGRCPACGRGGWPTQCPSSGLVGAAGRVKSPNPVGSAMTPAEVSMTSPEENDRSEEHTSELQSRFDLVCRLLLEKK